MAETKQLSAEDQLKAAGYDPKSLEGELDPADPANNIPSQKVEPEPGLDQEESEEAPQGQASLDSHEDEGEEAEESTEEQETEQQTEESPNDKTWQSQYDKEHHRATTLEQQVEQFKQQNQALMAMFGTLQNATGNGNGQQAVPQEKKKPELWDYIQKEDYYRDEAMDPGTPSGQAYQQWQDELGNWRTEQNLVQFEQRQRQKSQETAARTQAQKLAEKHVEFRNPLTMQPDMNKIAQFMDNLSNSDDPDLWADLYDFFNQRQSKTNQTQQTQKPQPDLTQIGRNANKVSKTTGQSATEETKKKVPKSVQTYQQFFGAGFELPVDVELE